MAWQQAVAERAQRKAGASRAGRVAKAAGESTEAAVEAACAAYRRAGLASVDKLATPTKVVRRMEGGRFVGVFTGKAPVDFQGTLAGGRAVAIELKSSAVPRVPLEHRGEDRLRGEQGARLADLHRLGAACAVLVVVATGATRLRPGPARRWFLLRWPEWLAAVAEAEGEGRASIPLVAMETHGRECAVDCGWPDWLAALSEMP
jgi:penicillin-binding protein-related factor A (putative recombinase)